MVSVERSMTEITGSGIVVVRGSVEEAAAVAGRPDLVPGLPRYQRPESPGSPAASEPLTPQEQEKLDKYRKLRGQSDEDILKELHTPTTGSKPVLGIGKDAGETLGGGPPGPPEAGAIPDLPEWREGKEILPSFESVVTDIRILEAMSPADRYLPVNLEKLELRYAQFKEYFAKMKNEEVVEWEKRLKYYSTLEQGLADGSTTTDELLRFVSGLDEDPIISATRRKIDILDKLAYLPADRKMVLANLIEQRDGLLKPAERLIPKQQQRILDLAQKQRTQDLSDNEREEAFAGVQALQDYKEDVSSDKSNRLLNKVGRLKNDPAKANELRELLIQILKQEKSETKTVIDLIQQIEVENFINENMPRTGEVEPDWLGELEKIDECREQTAEAIEKFEDLASFRELVIAREQAYDNKNEAAAELAEARIGRYLYNAKKLGITSNVHSGFNDLLRRLRMPEISPYGDSRNIADSDVARLVGSFQSNENLPFYRRKQSDFEKFAGVIGEAARYAEARMLDELDKIGNPDIVDRQYLFGEWDLNRQDKKMEQEALNRQLWTRNYAGYYNLRINPESPYAREQLEKVADQWMVFMQSGVIPKNPNEQMGELRKFSELWVSLATEVYLKIYTRMVAENPQRVDKDNKTPLQLAADRVAELRRQYKFRVEAPLIAYFNAVDDAENFAAMSQNLSDEIEFPEVWRQGYGSLEGTVARLLYEVENNPLFSRAFFHPEGSRGYLSGENAMQRFLRKTVTDQLIKHVARFRISDKIPGQQQKSDLLNNEINTLRAGIEQNKDNIIERRKLERQLKIKLQERVSLSQVGRKFNLQRIGLDQPAEAFVALYEDLTKQSDYQCLSQEEQKKVEREHLQRVREAWQLAENVISMTGEQSVRGGPTIIIRLNSELKVLQADIQRFEQEITDMNQYIRDHQYVEIQAAGGGSLYTSVLEIDEKKTPAYKAMADEIRRRQEGLVQAGQQLETARNAYEEKLKSLQSSPNVAERREDWLPVTMAVRFAQYAVYRAEKAWVEKADEIMKGPGTKEDKDTAIQRLCLEIIPDVWNIKKNLVDSNGNPDPKARRLNLCDVLEGVYREALDRVFAGGFRATLEVPTVNAAGAIVNRTVTDDSGKTLYIEDIAALPESNSMLMVYFATEQLYHNTITSRYRVAQAKAGKGGIMGRALRILDPAFNRFSHEDNPRYLRDDQGLQRAMHAAIEAQWQRHFQIRIEVLERCIVGANIRKNKTGKPEDRYKMIDGDPGFHNLLEWGREETYVTSRIMNHAEETLTHADRRARRAAILGLYSPMQKVDTYTESGVEDSREYAALVDTQSGQEKAREGEKFDYIYTKLQAGRWLYSYNQRVALEGGLLKDGRFHTGLFEKVFLSADRANKKFGEWARHRRTVKEITGPRGVTGGAELLILDQTADVEWEDILTLMEEIMGRQNMSTEAAFGDLSYSRFAQGSLWKDGVPSFLPDGTLNFQRMELGEGQTLTKSDNGTSRHTNGIWSDRIQQWRTDPRMGGLHYPGIVNFMKDLERKRRIFGRWQSPRDILISRKVR